MSGHVPVIEEGRCNCSALRRASRRVGQLYDAALAPCGLRSTQVSLLAEIDRCGARPPTVRLLAETLVMDRSTLGQNLRPLERDGLVAIVPGATDRRRRHAVLTEAGYARLREARALWDRAQSLFEARFGAERADGLRHTLREIVEMTQ